MRGTVRVRLALVYGLLFLLTAAGLLVAVNLLLRNMLQDRVNELAQNPLPALPPSPSPNATSQHTESAQVASDLSDAVQRFQWGVAAVAIAALTILSILGGWLLAGRILRPLRHITATARRLSVSNLHDRIGLSGPDDELKELGDTFDAMLDRLERSVDSQRRFVANASHELRTPLAIQRAAIQIGLDNPTPERLARVRADMLAVNERTERLIDSLLTLAQSEHGLDERHPVRLDEIVRLVTADVVGPDITVTVEAEPTTVLGDPVLLTRLVTNLVDNAMRYNRPGGTVQVTVMSIRELTVRNTGPDVPEERVDELFEPFRRLSASRSGDGVGLGLSLVASISQAHGAELLARPNAGGGLEITVRFGEVPTHLPDT
jgi:signal transduction histidine kinase